MAYDLFYWPGIPGRGEFIRLVLEESGAPYRDLGRLPRKKGGGVEAILKVLKSAGQAPPFAVPALRHGKLLVSQTATICRYLAERHRLVPKALASRLHADQLQLTVADLVSEAHDTHHPISVGLYYRDQKKEARARSAAFITHRVPKFLDYFERVLAQGKGKYLLGRSFSYVDLSLFQVLEGLAYAFPRAFARTSQRCPRCLELREAVRARPRMRAYLASDRRLAFNEDGIFRHYPELDR
jgi:glutathione S-transferase